MSVYCHSFSKQADSMFQSLEGSQCTYRRPVFHGQREVPLTIDWIVPVYEVLMQPAFRIARTFLRFWRSDNSEFHAEADLAVVYR